jgi:predicted nucleotidyltransferase
MLLGLGGSYAYRTNNEGSDIDFRGVTLFDDLLKLDLEPELRTAIDELLEAKKRTTEKEENPQMPVIKKYIEEEIQKQKVIADELADDHNRAWSALDKVFIEII